VGAGTGGARSDGPDGAKSTGGTGAGDPAPRSKASCEGLAATCGPHGNEDCCTSPLVTGGTFYQSYDAADGGLSGRSPATVSDFRLDKFEITVGTADGATLTSRATSGSGRLTMQQGPRAIG
jgi:formylglycine-generating enzyme